MQCRQPNGHFYAPTPDAICSCLAFNAMYATIVGENNWPTVLGTRRTWGLDQGWHWLDWHCNGFKRDEFTTDASGLASKDVYHSCTTTTIWIDVVFTVKRKAAHNGGARQCSGVQLFVSGGRVVAPPCQSLLGMIQEGQLLGFTLNGLAQCTILLLAGSCS